MALGLTDTLALLKAGYKKKDIEALEQMDIEAKKKLEEEKKDPDPEPKQKTEDAAKHETKEKDPEPDYKKLYEEAQAELTKVKEDLSSIQDKNIHSDSSGTVTEAAKKQEETLKNLVRSYM